jgi:hypothetical protein
MNKRGAYFFVIDALIAGSIIFITLLMIFGSYSILPESSPTIRMIDDYTKFLISTKIRQFQGPFVEQLKADGNITNLDNTLLEQLTEFYYLNSTVPIDKTAMMAGFVKEISKGVISSQRGFALYLNQSLIYNYTSSKPLEETAMLLSTQKIVFKRINESYIYGPIILEVKIWV